MEYIAIAVAAPAKRRNLAPRWPGRSLLTFLAALMMMYKPLKDVTRINMAVQIALSSATRVFELVEFRVVEPDRKCLDRPRRHLRHHADDGGGVHAAGEAADDLGARGDPIAALRRLTEIVQSDLAPFVVEPM